MSGTLALSTALAAMDRDALESLVRLRRPHAVSSISDPIGLAAELLRTDSIERAIRPLEREDLAALLAPEHAPVERTQRLIAAGLLGMESDAAVPLPEVEAVLTASLERVGLSPGELGAAPTPHQPEHTGASESWYVPALTAVGIAAEMLRSIRARPGGLNRSGSVAVATVKALADATGIPSRDVSYAIDTLLTARLLVAAPRESQLLWSRDAERWLALGSPDRWLLIGSAVMREMPAPLISLLRESDFDAALAAVPHRFPLLPASTSGAIERFAELAAHLGLTVDGALSAAGHALLESEDAALAVARRDMPAAAPGVYIQPDLSVIVPGPLSPDDEAALARLSVPEQTGIASTRRITESALAEALERGVDADGARDTFARLSLTGIPQPLDYMLASLAERVRSIVVHDHFGGEARTRIDVARDELRSTLLVDRALQHLQLAQGPDGALYSKLRAEHVLAALGDARYTASFARTDAGAPRVADAPPAPDSLSEDLQKLVARVHHAASAEPSAGAFTRRLELAIKDRSTVRVTASAQGRTHIFTLLPTALDAGRLRATDPRAGVERTLPVSTITAVE